MTLVVAGIILGLAAPSFREFQRSNAMTSAANDLVTAALLARSEAVKRQLPVTLCITEDPAAAAPVCTSSRAGAFVVFVDASGDGNAVVAAEDVVLLRGLAPGGPLRLFMNHPAVTYGPSGFLRNAAAARFLFCDDRSVAAASRGQSPARVLLLDPTGRSSIRSDVATVQTTLALLEDAECVGT